MTSPIFRGGAAPVSSSTPSSSSSSSPSGSPSDCPENSLDDSSLDLSSELHPHEIVTGEPLPITTCRRRSLSGTEFIPSLSLLQVIPSSQLSSAGPLSPRVRKTGYSKTSRVRPEDLSSFRQISAQLHSEQMKAPITEYDLPLLFKSLQNADDPSFDPVKIAEEIQFVSRRPGTALFALFHQLYEKSEEKWFNVVQHLFIYPEGVKFLRSYLGLHEHPVGPFARKLMVALQENQVAHTEVLASLTMMTQNDMTDISSIFCREYLKILLGSSLNELKMQLRNLSLKEKNFPVNEALERIYGIYICPKSRELLSLRRECLHKEIWEDRIGKFLLLDVIGSEVLSQKKISSRRKQFLDLVKSRIREFINNTSVDRFKEVHRNFVDLCSSCQSDGECVIEQNQGVRFLEALRLMERRFSSHFERQTSQCPTSSSSSDVKSSPLASPRSLIINPLHQHLRTSYLFLIEDFTSPYNHVATVTEFLSNLKFGFGAERLLNRQIHSMRKRNEGNLEFEFREALFLSGLMLDPRGCSFLVRFFDFSKENKSYDIDAFTKMAVSFFIQSEIPLMQIDDVLESAATAVLEKETKQDMFRGVNLSSLLMRELGTHYWGDQLGSYLDFVEAKWSEIFIAGEDPKTQLDLFIRTSIQKLHELTLPPRLKQIFFNRSRIVSRWLNTENAEREGVQFAGIELILRVLNPALVQRKKVPQFIELNKMLQRLANQSPFGSVQQEAHFEIKTAIYDEFVGKHQEFINGNLFGASRQERVTRSSEAGSSSV